MIIVLIPPLALIFLVLGTIFLGIATPTEGGAMGATGALILAFAKRRLSFKTMSDALETTTRLACFVMFILIGSRIFSLTFYGINGHIWVEELFVGLPGGEWGFLIAVNILVFILGCFIDFFEIAFIVVPLLAPVAVKFGIDLVWFGVVLGVNMQTRFLTPPFGFALFYMRSVAPAAAWFDKVSKRTIAGVSTLQIYRGAVAFIILQCIMIVVVLLFPRLSIPYGWAGDRSIDHRDRVAAAWWRRRGPAGAAAAGFRRAAGDQSAVSTNGKGPSRGPFAVRVIAGYSSFLRCRPIMKVS